MLGNGGGARIRVYPGSHTLLYGLMLAPRARCFSVERAVAKMPTSPNSSSARSSARTVNRKPRRRAGGREADAAARAPLTQQTWIEAATDVLVDQGIDHVRVDVLATQLGVTRGSFYWHFKDREDLLRSVLQAWRLAATENLTQRLERASAEPREQLRDVLSLPFRGRSAERASRIELSIRAWARRDTMARQIVDEADTARVAYIAQIFSGMGYGLAEARQRALVTYSLNIACSLLAPAGTAARQEHWLDFVERLMQGRPLDA